ncbi:MAG: hypothetical protein ABH877_01090, partial [bacterium]
ESLGDRGADARGAARYQCHFAFQSHLASSPFEWPPSTGRRSIATSPIMDSRGPGIQTGIAVEPDGFGGAVIAVGSVEPAL